MNLDKMARSSNSMMSMKPNIHSKDAHAHTHTTDRCSLLHVNISCEATTVFLSDQENGNLGGRLYISLVYTPATGTDKIGRKALEACEVL